MRFVSSRTGLLFGTIALLACKNITSLGGPISSGGTGGTGGSSTGGVTTGPATSSGTGGTGGSSTGTGAGGNLAKVDKVDLLFEIDNSRSMADKQQILTFALSDLVTGLTSPPCLDPMGNYVSRPGPLEPCPMGSARQYQPVRDIHVGVVSSSLGGRGSDSCAAVGPGKLSNDDKGHLLSREDAVTNVQIATYQNMGFLAWDPAQALSPPGEKDEGKLVTTFTEMVLGVGQVGCGYEAQLESWYRFLADPDPRQSVMLDAGGKVQLVGLDTVLLEQRKNFLRPSSMLVIVMLTDENDCSVREEGQYYFSAQQKGPNGSPFHLPKARAICETSPGDMCCFSCGSTGPVDGSGNPLCADDPACKDGNGKTIYLDEVSDNINVRCFEQKRRFGIDFLYPIERYVGALSGNQLPDRTGTLLPNPIFTDLDPSDGDSAIRDPGLVIALGIVGVPWQDIAKNPADLKQGFKTAGELTQPDAEGHTTWDVILGDHENYGAPLDPFMHESTSPRTGENPVIKVSITPPGAPPASDNAINRHDYGIPKKDDLQYACVMPIAGPRDCSIAGINPSCDCEDKTNDNPLCIENPNDGNNPTLQIRAKAYPGLRELAVLKGIGDRAVIGSICAGQINDPQLADYAYRPAVASLLDRMKSRLQ